MATSTPRFKETLESHSAILVECVPVGGTSARQFDQYLRLLRSFGEMAIPALTRPSDYRYEACPLKYFDWDVGAVYFNFTRGGAEAGSRFGGLLNHRQPLAVVGLCDCAACPDLEQALRDFHAAVQERHRSAHVAKCFVFGAFDHSEDRMPGFLHKNKTVELFPPGAEHMHMIHLTGVFAVQLLMHFEKEIPWTQPWVPNTALTHLRVLTGLDYVV